MLAKLLVTAGPDKGRFFYLDEEVPLLIGRSRHTETGLKDLHISRVHCEVELDGNQITVTDLESASGTFVNGKRITEYRLKKGDVLRIGETEFSVQTEGETEPSSILAPSQVSSARLAPLPAERLQELAGKKISHYEIGAVLAKGQKGLVFRGRDLRDDKAVALKIFWPQFADRRDEVRRFVRAIKTMLPVRHENLVALYGAGRTGTFCWVAMEYVEGESLTEMIQRIGSAGMLDWRNALRVAIHVARALVFAHSQHIIHRNITPRNILVRGSDKVTKLGDMMLAKALEGTLAEQITKPGEIVGDVSYLSPEQAGGASLADARSDIFSLGATVYALLAGRPPFQGQSLVETVMKIQKEEPVPPKKYQLSIPDLFEGSVLKMLAKRPEQRYQTAAELLTELNRVAKFQGLTV